MHPYLFVLLPWCDVTVFILSSSTQRYSAEEMDSTESSWHEASAHVCYGQYTCIICSHSLSVWCMMFLTVISRCCCFQKWHLSTQQSPYVGSPALRSCKTNLQPRQEVRVGNHVSFILCFKERWHKICFKVLHINSQMICMYRRIQAHHSKSKTLFLDSRQLQQRLDHFWLFILNGICFSD